MICIGKMVCGGPNMQTVHAAGPTLPFKIDKWYNRSKKGGDYKNDYKNDKNDKKKKNAGNLLKPHLTMYTILAILFCILK